MRLKLIGKSGLDILILVFLIFTGCSRWLHKKPIVTEPGFIEAMVNGKPQNYRYAVSGVYDTTAHVVLLKASDTAGIETKTWFLRLQLGKQKLEKLKYPF